MKIELVGVLPGRVNADGVAHESVDVVVDSRPVRNDDLPAMDHPPKCEDDSDQSEDSDQTQNNRSYDRASAPWNRQTVCFLI